MRRGINLGNALDVDPTAAAIAAVDEADLDVIVAAGFDTLRLPVRWTAHSAERPPFTLDESFARLVDDAIGAALDRGLEVIIDLHHASDITMNPDEQEQRFGAIWTQIAQRYAGLRTRLPSNCSTSHGRRCPPTDGTTCSVSASTQYVTRTRHDRSSSVRPHRARSPGWRRSISLPTTHRCHDPLLRAVPLHPPGLHPGNWDPTNGSVPTGAPT